ncbi:hypothetical protein J2S74_002221 [Evansella vedderi]|uniref:Uncharacterized protein n=1 Tax=Evansella vedderi TaxID=38282 RepID=A0ABT9ZUC4_9BACI|nr:hypothetical protein [Evansella vedderi]MDQ0254842.1 hypothetical protein [Evansella vedderi]
MRLNIRLNDLVHVVDYFLVDGHSEEDAIGFSPIFYTSRGGGIRLQEGEKEWDTAVSLLY